MTQHDLPWAGMIGLAGAPGSGRLVSDILYTKHGFQTFSLEDNLREALLALDPMLSSTTSLRQLVDEHEWEGAKDHRISGPEVQRLLRTMRTDVGRSFFGSTAWTSLTEQDITSAGGFSAQHPVVVDDIRHDDEAAWVRSVGGQMWSVIDHSPDSGSRGAMPLAPDLADHIVIFDGDVTALATRIEGILNSTRTRVGAIAEEAA